MEDQSRGTTEDNANRSGEESPPKKVKFAETSSSHAGRHDGMTSNRQDDFRQRKLKELHDYLQSAGSTIKGWDVTVTMKSDKKGFGALFKRCDDSGARLQSFRSLKSVKEAYPLKGKQDKTHAVPERGQGKRDLYPDDEDEGKRSVRLREDPELRLEEYLDVNPKPVMKLDDFRSKLDESNARIKKLYQALRKNGMQQIEKEFTAVPPLVIKLSSIEGDRDENLILSQKDGIQLLKLNPPTFSFSFMDGSRPEWQTSEPDKLLIEAIRVLLNVGYITQVKLTQRQGVTEAHLEFLGLGMYGVLSQLTVEDHNRGVYSTAGQRTAGLSRQYSGDKVYTQRAFGSLADHLQQDQQPLPHMDKSCLFGAVKLLLLTAAGVHSVDKLKAKYDKDILKARFLLDGHMHELCDKKMTAGYNTLERSGKFKDLVEICQEGGLNTRLKLLPHQVVAIQRMVELENDPFLRGGLQAEEMGMGKTAAMFGLICYQRAKRTQQDCTYIRPQDGGIHFSPRFKHLALERHEAHLLDDEWAGYEGGVQTGTWEHQVGTQIRYFASNTTLYITAPHLTAQVKQEAEQWLNQEGPNNAKVLCLSSSNLYKKTEAEHLKLLAQVAESNIVIMDFECALLASGVEFPTKAGLGQGVDRSETKGTTHRLNNNAIGHASQIVPWKPTVGDKVRIYVQRGKKKSLLKTFKKHRDSGLETYDNVVVRKPSTEADGSAEQEETEIAQVIHVRQTAKGMLYKLRTGNLITLNTSFEENISEEVIADVIEKAHQGMTEFRLNIFDCMRFERAIIDEPQEAEVVAAAQHSNIFMTEGASRINAVYRWCVSGTPFTKNKDVHGILKFLRHPLAEAIGICLRPLATAPNKFEEGIQLRLRSELGHLYSNSSLADMQEIEALEDEIRCTAILKLAIQVLQPLTIRQFERSSINPEKASALSLDVKIHYPKQALDARGTKRIPENCEPRLLKWSVNNPELFAHLNPRQCVQYYALCKDIENKLVSQKIHHKRLKMKDARQLFKATFDVPSYEAKFEEDLNKHLEEMEEKVESLGIDDSTKQAVRAALIDPPPPCGGSKRVQQRRLTMVRVPLPGEGTLKYTLQQAIRKMVHNTQQCECDWVNDEAFLSGIAAKLKGAGCSLRDAETVAQEVQPKARNEHAQSYGEDFENLYKIGKNHLTAVSQKMIDKKEQVRAEAMQHIQNVHLTQQEQTGAEGMQNIQTGGQEEKPLTLKERLKGVGRASGIHCSGSILQQVAQLELELLEKQQSGTLIQRIAELEKQVLLDSN